MSKRTRRKHASSMKAALPKKHHVQKVPVSDVCDQAQVQPSLFYIRQRQLFENAETALEGGGNRRRARRLVGTQRWNGLRPWPGGGRVRVSRYQRGVTPGLVAPGYEMQPSARRPGYRPGCAERSR